jgi:hypothetical protein
VTIHKTSNFMQLYEKTIREPGTVRRPSAAL